MLLVDKQELLDMASAFLVWHPTKAEEVPQQSSIDVVICAINNWLCSKRLNAMTPPKPFHNVLHVGSQQPIDDVHRCSFAWAVIGIAGVELRFDPRAIRGKHFWWPKSSNAQ